MFSLGDAVRSIRKRRGETLKKFASRFHLSHPSISAWESGKVTPTWQNLAILLQLAEGEAEQDPILDALQDRLDLANRPTVEEVLASIADATAVVERTRLGPDSPQSRDVRSIRLLEAAQRIVEETGGPPLLAVMVLEIVESVLGRPGADEALNEIASYAQYILDKLKKQAPVAAQLDEMARTTDRFFGNTQTGDDEEDETPSSQQREDPPK